MCISPGYLLLPLLFIAPSLWPQTLWAQAPAPVLETLVVKAELPAQRALASSLLSQSAEALLPGPRTEASEWLQGLPGVQVDNRTNLAQDSRISLRGFGARSAFGVRGVELRVDGIPLSQADGQGQLSSVALNRMAQVEVIRGPLAGLYGSGAGGVIALSSQIPEQHALRLDYSGGRYGLRRQQLAGDARSGAWAGSLQYAAQEQVGLRPHATAEREQWAAQGAYVGDSLQVRLGHEQSHDPLLQDPLGLTLEQWRDDPYQSSGLAEQFNTRKTVAHRQSHISLRQVRDHWHWQASRWVGERDITQFLAFSGAAPGSSGGVVDLARQFEGGNLALGRDLSLAGRPLSLLLGAEQAAMEDRRQGFVNNQGQAGDRRRDELGRVESQQLYSLLQWQPSGDWELYSGWRHNRVQVAVVDYWVNADNPDDSGRREFRGNAWALGSRYTLGAGWSLFASAGEGFETPTLTEMAYSRTGTGLNTQLDAAHIRQQEAGLAFAADQRLLSLTGFYIETRDELLVDQSSGGRTSYRNAAATRRQGAELFARWQLSPYWRTGLSITSLQADYSAGDWRGQSLPGVAGQQSQWSWQYLPLGRDQWVLSLELHQRSRIASGDTQREFAPGYRRLDLGIQGNYTLAAGYVRGWLRLVNALDKAYIGSVIVNQSNGRAFEPAPGREWQLGVSLGF